ncbi:5278_t:CDS:2 [Funneliformis mosseae]|uniref:5278_t:CDS:1 n=1 Tax=Funneliformis mosseae TaxID=27381 RepID=A0A9N8YRV8_FUNMO|nr:5278_t:CDS:2 [Funneliformis mosseae]
MTTKIIKKIPISNISSRLIDLQTGLGAAKFGLNVKKVSLVYSKRNNNAGARYFKKENLPRIIYNNPGLPVEVIALEEKDVKPTLTVEFGI